MNHPEDEKAAEKYFYARIRKDKSGCWIWTGTRNRAGYGVMYLCGRQRKPASRFSYEIFVEPVDSWDGFMCCHKCDNPPCVNPDHLFKGTSSDNMKDAGRKGRHWAQQTKYRHIVRHTTACGGRGTKVKYSGIKNQKSRLTKEQVWDIIARLDSGQTTRGIANIYGVCQSVTAVISSGASYKKEIEEYRALSELDRIRKEGESG